MTKKQNEEMVEKIETAQKQVLAVEDHPDATDSQKAEAGQKFNMLQRAKNGIKSGYIKTKTFLGRLFHRVKNFLSTVWNWLRGLARVIIDAVVSAFRGLAAFLGRVLARVAGGLQDVADKGIRVVLPSQEDEVQAQEREALAELKRLNVPLEAVA